ncbi:spermidine/putrescine ABC transporter substrate-binding protein [Streptomyces sp. CB01881]|uniref:polyamine ABC transporter substrate-binding protein n=1 Tax=Streptomyces sp. CB01881 TaxID=2078691 RepID=UPI000CDC3176|nr:spermidine/putrescine ABC transporter substrate-binding protein [Streptomyces sp. CB01881]AUY49655.1 polyamine ABC transporter substrate-binding protein [Streptomyces sp. CB01881]TYC73049.1 spermidine/putrescine ABC transporter substrate-binding protein [Streptomyces sp. CB01881]
MSSTTLTRRPAGRRRPTRRSVLGTAGLLGLGSLTGCGIPSAYVAEDRRSAPDRSEREQRLAFSNWTQYIDTDDEGGRPTLDAFTERTGIQVTYTEDINDNDEFFGKIGPVLTQGTDPGRDLMVVSDWMAGRYVSLGWVQTMDRANLPNVTAQLDPQLADPAFDPGRRRSVPWQSGITGIAYNRKELGREIRSTADLWAPDLKGRVTLFAGLDEALGLLMLAHGADLAAFTEDDAHRAMDLVQKMVDARHVRRFTGNDYTSDLASGAALACQAYSGDAVQLTAENPDIAFVVPEEGGELWAESLLIPNRAGHKRNAELLIDHYYQPEVAAELAAAVQYICPVPAAREVLAASGDKEKAELAEHPLVFPTEEMRARLHTMRDVTSAERPGLHKVWGRITGV